MDRIHALLLFPLSPLREMVRMRWQSGSPLARPLPVIGDVIGERRNSFFFALNIFALVIRHDYARAKKGIVLWNSVQ